MKDLEKEFKEAVEKATEEIDKYLKEASEALEKAVEVSEKYGIPFYTDVSPIGQSYRPESFEKKWSKLIKDDEDEIDEEQIYDLLGDYLPEYEGWQHSMVC